MAADQVALFQDGELPDAPEPLVLQVQVMWNETAKACGWEICQALTEKRKRAIRRALKDHGGIHAMRPRLAAASRNRYLLGITPRQEKFQNWKPNIDWFTRDETVVKMLEGRYPDEGAVSGAATPHKAVGTHDSLAQDRAKLRNYRPNGFWPPSWGERPENAGCRLPAEILRDWREINRVAVQAPESVRESREERFAASIAIYRKIGRYEDANRVESELAALQGRPAVLVPAPDVAGLGMPERERPLPNPARPSSVNNSARKRGQIVTDVVPDFDEIPEGDDFGAE